MANIIYDLGNNENQALLFSWELPTSGNLPSINFYYSGFINPSLRIDNSQVDENGITKNSTIVDIPHDTKPGTYSIDRIYLYDKYGPVKELTTKSEVSEYLKSLGISYDDFTIEVIGLSPPKVDNEAPKLVSAELKSKQINLSNGDTQIQLNSRIIDYSGLQYMQAGYNIVDANGNVDYSSSASTYLFPFDLGFSTPEVEKNYPSIINLSKPKAGKYELQSISLNDKAGNSISKNGKTDITAYLASSGIKYSDLSFEAIGEPPTHKDVNPPKLLSATLSSQTIDQIKGENNVLLNLSINDETKLNSAFFRFTKIDSNGVIDIDSSFSSYTSASDAGNTKDNYLSLVSTDSRLKNGLYVPSKIELTDILGNTKSLKNKDSVNDYLRSIDIDPATLTFNVIGDQPIQDIKINTIDLTVYTPYTPTKPILKEFKSGEPISIEIDYSDTSGLNKNDLGYIEINGAMIFINYSDIIKGDEFNGTVRTSFVIPNEAKATEYYLNNIFLRDASRNELYLGYNGYERDLETARSIFASKLGVSVNDLGFKLLKPNNAIVDSSAPTLNAIRLSANEIISTASGNQLIVEIDLTDASGVGSAFTVDSINLKDYSIAALSFAQIISIDGNLESKNYTFDFIAADIIKGDKNNCTLRAIIDFPSSMDSSEWELTNLSLRDKAGNRSDVYLASSSDGNKINYGQHTEVERDVFADTLGVKKEDLRFKFINSNQNAVDNEKPIIKDIRFSASQVELNGNDSEQTIEIDFEDATGLKFNPDSSFDDYIADIAIAPVNGLGKVIYLDFYARDLIKGDLKAGTVRKTFTIPKSEVSGERYIISLGISDRALNDRYIGSSGWDGVSKAEQDLIAFKLDIPSNKLGFNISNKNTSIVDLNAPTVKAIRFTDQDLIPPTISTYTITPSATTINEGAALTTSVATTNVTSGTTLYYSLSGPGITAADFSAGALTGSGTVGTDGKFSISHTLANDVTTEGAESVDIKLFSDRAQKVQVGSTVSISIADTSSNPINDGAATFAVSGTVQVGQVLTVAKTADDPDGNGSLSYQWQSSTDGNTWSNIGSNAATYTLTAAEQSKQIRVQVSYTDAQAFTEAITIPAGTVAAVNDGAATHSIFAGNGGTAVYIVGQRLLVEKTATDPDGGHGIRKYQWQSSADGNTWSNIGTNNEFYTLTVAEQAKQIRVQISYTDGEGFKENITVAGGYVPIVKEPIISITGNFIQSSTLTANVQLDPDSPYINSTFTYTWYANKEIIAAQTTKTLILTDDLVGKRISATASFTNSAGQSASISTAEKQVQAGFTNSKGIEVKADVRLENANLDGGFATINATTNPNAKKAVDALKANKVELSPTMVNFTIALSSNPTKPAENQTTASIAIGIDLVSDGIALSTGTGAASKPTPLSYYSVDSAGVASPFTYDPVSKTGANFYDTNSDGTPDLVTLAFVDGGRGDKDGIKNGKIVDPSTAATVNVSAVLANFKDSLLIADPLSDSPAALIVKAKLTSRAATVNEIGYVVLDKGETIDSISFAGLTARAQILFAGLESSDIPNLSSFSFDKSIALINGQSIRFFETTDSSFKELAAGKSSVAGLGSSFKFLSTTIDSSTTKATAASSSGINFSLEIAGSFAGLDSLIGVNQADLPILDFSALAGIEVTADLSLAREASYNSSIGFYKILAIDGSVRDPISGNVFLPGDSGYKNAALSNKVTNLKDLSIGNLQNTTNEIKINESGMLAPYAIVSGADTYFAYAAANADLISHFKVLGTNIIGLEDLYGGGDKDFDDVVIGIKAKTLSAI